VKPANIPVKMVIITDINLLGGPALGELTEDWLDSKDPGLASWSSLASDRARSGIFDVGPWTSA
jgi:hypothetical protein